MMTMNHSFKEGPCPEAKARPLGTGTAEKDTATVISLHASELVQGCSGLWEVSFVGPWEP